MAVPETEIEENVSAKAEKSHRIDSLDLLMYIGLLIITILTIWLFKHRRLRFVHETGVAVILGLIIGAIIHYTSVATELTHAWVEATDPRNVSRPPNTLRLRLRTKSNESDVVYQYMYRAVLDSATTSEHELDEKATFNPEVFFNVILPPIIFYAGYSMKHKHFFRNFGAIMTFAFLGTLVSSFAVGGLVYVACLFMPQLEMSLQYCFLFGAIVCATDTVTILAIFSDLHVDVDLYALVFGESVLNDAVAIVLSETVDGYSSTGGGFDGLAILRALLNFFTVFFGAFAMGAAMGCITALLTKFTHLKEFALLETSLFCLMSYATFLAAEAAGFSGVVAVLFCGICQAHYTYNNMSAESQTRTKQLFEVLNFLMENFVFTYIGVSTFTYQYHYWSVGFIAAALIAIVIGRALNIYPLSYMLNLGRSKKIPYNCQHMMSFAGLRGAMAYALAIRNAGSGLQGRLMFSTTIVVVIATVTLCGGLTTPMLQWLKIRVGVEDDIDTHALEAPQQHGASHNSLGPADSAGRMAEKARLVRVWKKLDSRFVKPLLTHAKPPLTETLPNWCQPLARLLTTDEQNGRTRLEADHHADSDCDLILVDGNNGTADNVSRSSRDSSPLTAFGDDGPLHRGDSQVRQSKRRLPVTILA